MFTFEKHSVKLYYIIYNIYLSCYLQESREAGKENVLLHNFYYLNILFFFYFFLKVNYKLI